MYYYVIVSSIMVQYTTETHIFPANEKGEVMSWLKLKGSMRGSWTHEEVLAQAGYTLIHKSLPNHE
jgi:hypothetical protein